MKEANTKISNMLSKQAEESTALQKRLAKNKVCSLTSLLLPRCLIWIKLTLSLLPLYTSSFLARLLLSLTEILPAHRYQRCGGRGRGRRGGRADPRGAETTQDFKRTEKKEYKEDYTQQQRTGGGDKEKTKRHLQVLSSLLPLSPSFRHSSPPFTSPALRSPFPLP